MTIFSVRCIDCLSAISIDRRTTVCRHGIDRYSDQDDGDTEQAAVPAEQVLQRESAHAQDWHRQVDTRSLQGRAGRPQRGQLVIPTIEQGMTPFTIQRSIRYKYEFSNRPFPGILVVYLSSSSLYVSLIPPFLNNS